MSRLIVVSNRVSLPRDSSAGSVGGLAGAIADALRKNEGVWFGWSGEATPEYSGKIALERVDGVTLATVDLEPQDVDEYYNGYANRTLWPLFHDRIDLTSYERSFDAGYARVNARFAAALAPLVGADDLIWVHDYHLAPLARELRRLGVRNRIGFFLHIPWPARQLLTTLPGHQRLVQALFDYDVVGFQTPDHASAFQDYLAHEIGAPPADEAGRIVSFGKAIRMGAFPIGIDAQAFERAATSAAGRSSYRRMEESLAGRKMILGVDRLDHSKGLEERFQAYETFLERNPDQHGKVFMLQIATPSRDAVTAYQDLRARLDAECGRINGRFGSVDWVPLRYVNSSHRRDELAGIYRAAAVALVTPLRDGMNLVAKEFVAAQDPDDPGVLVLSRFAGAAHQLKAVISVNPYDRDGVADAIRGALEMDRPERLRRWRESMDVVRRDDVGAWRGANVAWLRPQIVEQISNDAA